MPDIVVQIIFMIMGAFLSVVLSRILIQNGRQIKVLSEEMKILSEEMKIMRSEMKSEMKLFGEKMDEGFRIIGEKLDKGFERIANLIVAEERNTRELIKAIIEKK